MKMPPMPPSAQARGPSTFDKCQWLPSCHCESKCKCKDDELTSCSKNGSINGRKYVESPGCGRSQLKTTIAVGGIMGFIFGQGDLCELVAAFN